MYMPGIVIMKPHHDRCRIADIIKNSSVVRCYSLIHSFIHSFTHSPFSLDPFMFVVCSVCALHYSWCVTVRRPIAIAEHHQKKVFICLLATTTKNVYRYWGIRGWTSQPTKQDTKHAVYVLYFHPSTNTHTHAQMYQSFQCRFAFLLLPFLILLYSIQY